MKTKTIIINGQPFDVPVSSDGKARGADLVQAAGLDSSQEIYEANEDGHKIVYRDDVTEGSQFQATPRFRAAAKNVARINTELALLVREYGDDSVFWPPSLGWVMLHGFKLPSGYNRPATDFAIMIPDNYGHGAPLRDCFIDPALRYWRKGEWIQIGHYFDAPNGYSPSEYKDWRTKKWSYLCLHMEEWAPQYTMATYMTLAFTYLSNPFHPWKGNESHALHV